MSTHKSNTNNQIDFPKVNEVEIVELLPTKIWWDKDMFGTVSIKMQHQGTDEFVFIQMAYDYRYTSNAHQAHIADRIVAMLKGEQ
jgi:hypothetical protein